MIDGKKVKKLLIILIILIIIVSGIFGIKNALARYTSSASNDGEIDVAFYILNASFDVETQRILLSEIAPRDTGYEYTFSVSNFNEKTRAQVDMEYYIYIRTTTNLPLTYKIYKKVNSEWTDYSNSVQTEIKEDADGTYLKEITVMDNENKKFELQHKTNLTDEFKIEVIFPTNYKAEHLYSDLIESTELSIVGNQIID